MEAYNHIVHIAHTYCKLRELLFLQGTEDNIFGQPARTAWVKTRDLAVDDISNERMAITHLLWLQCQKRLVIEDIEPYTGAVLIKMPVNL